MDRRPAPALACLLLLAGPLGAEDAKPLHAHWGFHPDSAACADPARPDKRWAPVAIPSPTPGCYRKRFTLTAGARFALAFAPGPLPADRTGFAVLTANQPGPLRWSVRGQGHLAGPALFGSVNLVRTTATPGKITVTATNPAGETASVDLWSTAVPLGAAWMREPAR
jgi:hypothetical protein